MIVQGDGLDKLIQSLDSVDVADACARGLYEAAGLIADAVRENVAGLPEQTNGERLRGVTPEQKADLLSGLGISKFEQTDEYVQTSVGFHGTGSTKTKRYPNGMPNKTLMRAVESGNSFRTKTPVVRPALNRTKKAAEQAIQKEVTEQIKKEI